MAANGAPRESASPSSLSGAISEIPLRAPAVAGSISPTSRDAALLSSQGLHIIDLENPFDTPWTCANNVPGKPTDIQWHPSIHRPSWILSAVGSSFLTWDLHRASPLTGAYTARVSHERAITCVDASTVHPDLVASGGLDGYVCLWDLRSPHRPAEKFYDDGLSVQKARLSPLNGDLIASAHGSRYCVWDLRKSSRPLRKIKAHSNRVRGLQWNPQVEDFLSTCSSDRTVKFWNWSRGSKEDWLSEDESAAEALNRTLVTECPISSVMHTPVGQGVLAAGDDLFLFDCRVRAISDRKAKVTPAYTWKLGEQHLKSVGLSRRQDLSLQHVSLVDQLLCIIPITSSLLLRIGADSASLETSSPAMNETNYSFRSQHNSNTYSEWQRTPLDTWARFDLGGIAQVKGSMSPEGELNNRIEEGKCSDNALEEIDEEESSLLEPSTTITAPDNVDVIDDEDDDLAVISGDLGEGENNDAPSKVIIVPPPRLAGATFAPNNFLVFFSALTHNHSTVSGREKVPNFRGLANLLRKEPVDANLEGNAEMVTDLRNISFSPVKGFAPWYARRSEWINETGPGHPSLREAKTDVATTAERMVTSGFRPAPSSYISKPPSRIFLEDSEGLLPTKRFLAEQYILHGSPHSICEHNKRVCEKHGLDQHASAWGYAAAILKPVVPLQTSVSGHGNFIAARRNIVEIKRRDGRGNPIGFDYAFDEPAHVTNPLQWAHVAWINHPFGRKLVKRLLQAFESQRDIQMLAMLTAVFAIETPSYRHSDTPGQARSGPVAIKFKTRYHVSQQRLTQIAKSSLLDPNDFEQHRAWRQTYADQLYTWGMSLKRLEILKSNGTSSPASSSDQDTMMSLRQIDEVSNRLLATCSICWEMIHGLCVTCPDCFHSSHPPCLDAWTEQVWAVSPCAAGCGCICRGTSE